MIRERRAEYTASGFNTELTEELKRDQAIILGKLDKFIAEIAAFQEANCRGCLHAKEQLIGTGEECCDYTYHKQWDDAGKCRGRHLRERESKNDTATQD